MMNQHRRIIKTTISKGQESPYQGYPQIGDIVYLIDDRDNRQAMISDWCEEECAPGWCIFIHSDGKIGLWFSDIDDQKRF